MTITDVIFEDTLGSTVLGDGPVEVGRELVGGDGGDDVPVFAEILRE